MADQFAFDGENPNERIVFVLRRHPWVLMRTGIWVVILLLALTALVIKFGVSWVTSPATFVIVPIVLYLIGRAWFLWANSVYVLTNQRLLAVHQDGWFVRNVKEVSLDMIITISHDVKGAMATLLNFGEIVIQASGATEKDLTLEFVYDPYEVQQRIVRAKRGGLATADATEPDEAEGSTSPDKP